MKLKIEDLRIGQFIEVSFTAKVEKLEMGSIRLRNVNGVAIICEGHLAEVPTPKEMEE